MFTSLFTNTLSYIFFYMHKTQQGYSRLQNPYSRLHRQEIVSLNRFSLEALQNPYSRLH